MTEKPADLRRAALHFHSFPKPGKLEIVASKPLANSRDLALAYSPGVAVPCEEIAADPDKVYEYTSKGNLVAVVSNGTAVLGLGNIGALASKPVMEGKSVLFKKFAGIDSIDIEVNEQDPRRFIEIVAPLEPSFGGINLEDIKAPECFEIEETLRQRMNIPVFHDDQHGTAIIVAAAVLNAMQLVGKNISRVKIVTSGAGAAAIACMNMLIAVGASRENIWIADSKGLVTQSRAHAVDRWRGAFAQDTTKTELSEVMAGADIYVGLSKAGALKPEMMKDMAPNPLIMALSNPVPEIMPELAREARPDAMICTGRSDYPNQVNNVLCFPFLFRGALDCGATVINEEMKAAAAYAIAKLAQEPVLGSSSQDAAAVFGRDYLIPNPFDQRLILRIAPAVAKAAMESGVSKRPIADFAEYGHQLRRFVFRSGLVMKPVFERAQGKDKRIAFADGEDERVLRAAQVMVDEGIGRALLIGRQTVIEQRIARLGLTLKAGRDFDVVDPDDDLRRYADASDYQDLVGHNGVAPNIAQDSVRSNRTMIGALAVRRGEADALICGLEGQYITHVRDIERVIGRAAKASQLSALSMLVMNSGVFFLADTYVNVDPSASEIAEIALQARDHLRQFDIEAKAALLSHSHSGARGLTSEKMREVHGILNQIAPGLVVDGDMHGDLAVKGEANLLLFPNLDAAYLSMTLLKELNNALPVGPLLMGTRQPAHILAPSVTSRGIVNMAAIAANEAIAG